VEAASGEVIKPTIGMFGFGLGFALPFTLLAVFPSWLKNLPKSGGWLNSVEVVLGFLVLALSMKYLSNIDQTYSLHLMSRDLYLAIWIVIFSLMGFYLLGKIKFKKDSDLPYVSFPRLVLVIIVFSFVVYLIPGLFGAPLKPISGLLPPMSSQSFTLHAGPAVTTVTNEEGVPAGLCDTPKYADKLEMPPGLSTYFDYKQALSCARKQNKPLLLDFVGHACSNCKEMETSVFTDPEVIKLLKNNFVIVKLYVDDRTRLPEADWVTSNVDGKVKKKMGQVNADLQIDRYKTNTQPYYVIVDKDEKTLGKPLGHTLDKQEFIRFLKEGIDSFEKK
jgi:thiol:disulfide interchange protein DsbD